MKAPLSWIREYVDLPATVGVDELTAKLTMLGLKLEAVENPADAITGPLVLGRVLTREPEPQKNGKTINWCTVDVGDSNGTGEPQGIVCGAHNFDVGDLVVCVLPGAVLPGGFAISARKTYGHVSAGMICSATEVGLGEGAHGSADGIMVLPADAGTPGDSAFAVLDLDDPVIEFEVNPDRAYALSLRGIARDAALGFDAPFADPAARNLPEPNTDGYPVVVDDPAGCPVFVTRRVTGFDATAPTPAWMGHRLEQAGMRSISLGVDISNYVMLELGQPNHCYAADKVAGPIRVRRAEPGERLVTLDDVERRLDPADLLIADDDGPIGLAGVMGGANTELDADSSDIVIEAAYFDPVTVFRTGKRHRLGSEASKRFERGVDSRLAQAAADRVAELLVELGGASAEPGVTVVGTPVEPVPIRLAADLPERRTGVAIDTATVRKTLTAVGCDVAGDEQLLTVTPPSWRPDLTDSVDLVEEVIRVVGYDKVPSVLPPAPSGRGLSPAQKLRRRVGLALAGAGYTETISYPFVGDADWDRLGLPAEDARRRTVTMANPLNAEEPQLTTTLLPGLLDVLGRNIGRGNGDLAIFEHSLVFEPTDGAKAPLLGVDRRPTEQEWERIEAAVPAQPMHLGVVLAGRRDRDGWWGEGRQAGWADAIGAIRDVAAVLGVDVSVRAATREPWHPGRCAEVLVGEESLGYAGELHPRVCRAYGVPERTAAAEIDLDALLAHAVEIAPAPHFSSYPVAKEDVALLVDRAVPAEDVRLALTEGAGELLESVRLFDIYEGEQVGAGKKSLAFALRFRAEDRTLAEGESGAARDAAVKRAAEATGAVQR